MDPQNSLNVRHRPSAELIWEPCLTNRAQAELGGSWGHISSLLIPDFCFTLLRGTPFPFHSYLCCPTCHFPFYYIFFCSLKSLRRFSDKRD